MPTPSYSLLLAFAVAAACGGTDGRTQVAAQRPEVWTTRVGGACEAGYCELMYLGMPQAINATDTSPGWFGPGQKLVISGTAYRMDGKSPAPGVVIYYHHTDHNGLYAPGHTGPESRTRHGHLRGWVKTGADGKYTLYTSRPAPYPDRSQPAHVHWLVKEPDVPNEYWTDDLVFEDDPLLAPFLDAHPPGNWGGTGISAVAVENGVQHAERDLILGLNIPHYRKTAPAQ